MRGHADEKPAAAGFFIREEPDTLLWERNLLPVRRFDEWRRQAPGGVA
ncbi:hypothetical protein [Halomonas cerina]|uniref:Uncharacterized protein n=1 Tax=Halomonas cerina TaxID=447424 RepID=A0A839VE92_9GAMM|nr:hypothetical protein [Halomonas cerina]MBB3191679.1 hypothetical protein [Halomonas cerina]